MPSKRLTRFADTMKKDGTPAERLFGVILRGVLSQHKREWQIQRQRIFRHSVTNGYIADYYVPRLRLVIEIDGQHHKAPRQGAYDKSRSEHLGSKGLSVLRFDNDEIKDTAEFRDYVWTLLMQC